MSALNRFFNKSLIERPNDIVIMYEFNHPCGIVYVALLMGHYFSRYQTSQVIYKLSSVVKKMALVMLKESQSRKP